MNSDRASWPHFFALSCFHTFIISHPSSAPQSELSSIFSASAPVFSSASSSSSTSSAAVAAGGGGGGGRRGRRKRRWHKTSAPVRSLNFFQWDYILYMDLVTIGCIFYVSLLKNLKTFLCFGRRVMSEETRLESLICSRNAPCSVQQTNINVFFYYCRQIYFMFDLMF